MAETFFIIDGQAHIYQVFYAIRGLTAPNGEPVNAVYGFARMLRKIRGDYEPDYMAVALDLPGKVFRHQLYEQYKANRKPMPEELKRQIPIIMELLDVERIPALVSEGFEADDVLGTVARLAGERGLRTVIVTPDKDAEQLIDDMTSVLHMHRDKEIMLDPRALLEMKGLEPRQVVELFALAGDSSDNIPGAPGVGPKTAMSLIDKFDSVEGIYLHLDQVEKNSVRRKLEENRETVELSRQLVVINRDAPLELDFERCRIGQADPEAVTTFYRSLGFRSLMPQDATQLKPAAEASSRQGSLFKSGAQPSGSGLLATIDSVEKNYSVMREMDEVRSLCAELRERGALSIDLETTSLEPREADIIGLALSWEPDQGVYIATGGPQGERLCELDAVLGLLGPIIEDESIGKIGQNLKYDIAVLMNYGVRLKGLVCDTMVADYLLHPEQRSHGLDTLAGRHLGYETIKISELIGTGKKQIPLNAVPVNNVAPYACEDADVALQLSEKLVPQLKREGLWKLFQKLELPLVPILAEMEWTGVSVDCEKLTAISSEFEEKLGELAEKIYAEAGERFNLNSPKQLSQVLFEKLKLPAPRGKKRETGYSTESAVLEDLKAEHIIARHLIEYRELSKLKSTYADALVGLVSERTRRTHTSFNQTVTATGRLSSSEPNLQNIPVRTSVGRRIRSAFVPGAQDMSLLSADYSQIELRVLAHCSGDETLRRAFQEGEDIHNFVAAQIHGVTQDEITAEMRRQAKAVNFGIVYGQTPYGLSRQIDVPMREASRFIDEYFTRYPKVKAFIGATIDQARQDGFVRTLSGRKRPIVGIRDTGSVRSAAERMAVNSVIQGSAADLIKIAMIRISTALHDVSSRARLLIQIHDELLFEVPDDEIEPVSRFVKNEMIGAMELDVPLKVDLATGKNWEEAK